MMNAAKFTADGGRVEVRAGLVGRRAVAVVEDDGVGIAPDLLRRVFDLFSRGPHGENGLGVGLAVIRGVVELHAGTVEVQSDGEGRGSRFIVRLPAISPDDTATDRLPCHPRLAGLAVHGRITGVERRPPASERIRFPSRPGLRMSTRPGRLRVRRRGLGRRGIAGKRGPSRRR